MTSAQGGENVLNESNLRPVASQASYGDSVPVT